MKKLLFIFALCTLHFALCTLHAQTYFVGTVVDADTKEPLIGATIYNASTKTGATSDLDGKFKLSGSGQASLSVSFMGYQTQNVAFTANAETVVALKSETVTIRGAEIIADIAVSRKTPVAVSTISPMVIEERLGTQEFPEILKSTPGVYTSKSGGGFGDSRVAMRGFSQENIAVMINGVPVNDMEWGGIYWSNWAGLSDVTRSMQVQRGLGAAKVSAPSVGGSINIVTKTTDAIRGGSLSYSIGNDGYNKILFSASTGLMDNGWAITLLGSKTWGDGYILGTGFSGYSYFGNISKQIGKNHVLSLTAVGAPQRHYQRYSGDMYKIGDWEKFKEKYRFNADYGFDNNGQRHSLSENYYHKPQISLNHYWNIDEKSTLSTALYVSIGRGGGTGVRGNNKIYGSSSGVANNRTNDGYFDYGKIMAENAANPDGSQMIVGSATNEHNWYGLLSTYTTKFGKYVDFYGGIDLRYYDGIHQAYITDLLGGAFYIDQEYRSIVSPTNNPEHNNTTLDWVNQKLYVGDLIRRDYTSSVFQGGAFAQGEFNYKDVVTAFISANANNNSYWKVDRFYYNNQRSETVNKWGWTVKGGANYNINKYFNVFGNIGYISRVPYMSSVFTYSERYNAINKDAKNEKIFSKELGAGFRSKYFTANLNLYHTNWNDKAMFKYLDQTNPDRGSVNLTGVNALHMGVELEMLATPVKNLEIKGMFSYGDWRWKGSAKGYIYDGNGNAIDKNYNPVEPMSDEHAWVQINGNNVHNAASVSSSKAAAAQMTAALGISYKFFNAFKLGLDANYYGRNYASYSLPSLVVGKEVDIVEPWKIPDVVLFDLFASYNFKIGPFTASITGNINNLFNTAYIADADDGSTHNQYSALVMYGFGRTMSLTLKIKF
ncbi:MAG: TonB-dependent receptor [Bacteroidales bacterium]|jgi:outer membrane cobalamin receptor|nr:TonB-dependent receptor [Bacteroidales bacterium]